MRRPLIGAVMGIAAIGALVVPSATVSAAAPLYKSNVTPASVGNLPSEGPEAYSFNEFGNEVNLTGVKLGKVVVMMSSWACQTGTWHTGDCGTAAGAKFSQAVTFNIYNPPALGSDVPGTLIKSVTQTFLIPYRPSANYAHCNGGNAGKWWDSTLATCFNGKATNITFASFAITLPTTDVVFGIAYNTTHYGYSPIGESAACFSTAAGCPYDSLNIALSQDPTNVTFGTDRYPGYIYQNAAYGGDYCDNGAAGTGTFRIDSPNTPSCWGSYIPAVALQHS